ncbi:MAG: hypothetical protein PVF20_10195 [Desulfobacterales bacterium]|jgi:hypothetical protein
MGSSPLKTTLKTLPIKIAMIVLGLQVAVLMGTGLFDLDGCQAEAKSKKGCPQIVKDAKKACDSEIKDDYFIALGNCDNIADKEERSTCIQMAKTELKEAKEDCKDQQDARKEVCGDLEETYYDPQVDPANFIDPDTIDSGNANPCFPLVEGPEWVYEGRDDADTLLERITVTVTADIKSIEFPVGSGDEFLCRVVRDVVEEFLGGDEADDANYQVVEDTDDWYAQDTAGNVWYLGEIAQNFIDGELIDVEGSWKSGRDSALPGIIMLASLATGDVYRQEYYLGDAEGHWQGGQHG